MKMQALLLLFVLRFGMLAYSYDPEDPKNLQLLEAVEQGNTSIVQELLKSGADPNTVNTDDYSALEIAVQKGHTAVVKALIQGGANVQMRKRRSLLWSAAHRGDVENIRLLIAAGADIKETPQGAPPILHYIILSTNPANLEVIEELVRSGADLNAKDHQGFTPMLMAVLRKRDDIIAMLKKAGARSDGVKEWEIAEAAVHGDLTAIENLMKSGVSLNAEDHLGRTPFIAAIHGHQNQILERLIQLGASPTYRTLKDGTTPLMIVAANGDLERLNLLLQLKVPLEDANNDGRTALMLAAISGKWQAVERLMKAGAAVNVKDQLGYSVLTATVRLPERMDEDHLRVLQVLLEGGADPNKKGEAQESPLQLAVDRGSLETITLLRANGAALGEDMDYRFQNAIGAKNLNQVALYLAAGYDEQVKKDQKWINQAAQEGSVEMLRLFLKAGATAVAEDSNGSTPLSAAIYSGDVETVRELLNQGAKPQIIDLEYAAERGFTRVLELVKTSVGQEIKLYQLQLKAELTRGIVAMQPAESLEKFRAFEKVLGRNYAALLLFQIAESFLRQKNDLAEQLFQELLEKYPGDPQRISAMMALGTIAESRGDQSGALRYYRKAAESSYASKDQFDWQVGGARAAAIKKLALYYESINDCKSAIYWWRQYGPPSWCGNEAAATTNWKIHRIAVCQIETGDEEDGLAMLEDSVFNRNFEPSLLSALYLVEFYYKKGKLDLLEKKLNERADGVPIDDTPQRYIDLIHLYEKKDADGIWTLSANGNEANWIRVKAIDYFIKLGAPAKELALRELAKERSGRYWAATVLGRMKATEAIKPLIAIIRTEKSPGALDHYFSALAMIEDPQGLDIIRKYASEGSSPHKEAAARTLENLKNLALREE